MTSQSIRVLIVDDHPTVCEGLGHRIAAQTDMRVCGEAADVKDALCKIGELRPQVVIIDIGLRESDGLELIKQVKEKYASVKTLVHSMYDESVYASRCLQAGAMGYVNKEADPNDVIEAIREIMAGGAYLSRAMTNQLLGRGYQGGSRALDPMDSLTNRQLEVFRLIGAGRTTAQIAERLSISIHTVETHRENIKHKLNVENVSELTRLAVLWAAQKGEANS